MSAALDSSEGLRRAASPIAPFDPLQPEFARDRYAVYRRYREVDPVHWCASSPSSSNGRWVLFRYADVKRAMTDDRFGRTVPIGAKPVVDPAAAGAFREFFALISHWVIFRDAPEHDRLRAPFARAFGCREVTAFRVRVEAAAEALLDRLSAQKRFDLVADYAFALSASLISDALGLECGHEVLRHWSNTLGAAIDARPSLETMQRANAMAVVVDGELRELVRRRRSEPRADLISALVARANERGEPSDDEIVSNCAFLLGAGQETTTSLISFGMRALLSDRPQLERLATAPESMAAAIDEFLRYESPVQLTARVVRERLEIDGRVLEAGDHVDVVIGAANRDPIAFPGPDVIDLRRNDNENVAFALGPHRCVGAMLAQMEAEVAIRALMRRMPKLALVEREPVWRRSVVFRSLERLIVEC